MLPMTGTLKYEAKCPTKRSTFLFLVCSIITVTLLSKILEQNVLEISSNDKPRSSIVFICSDTLAKLELEVLL